MITVTGLLFSIFKNRNIRNLMARLILKIYLRAVMENLTEFNLRAITVFFLEPSFSHQTTANASTPTLTQPTAQRRQ